MYDYTFEHTDSDNDELYIRGHEGSGTLIVTTYADNDEVALDLDAVRRLHSMLGEFIARTQPRSYVVGLPVIVTVNHNGTVEYDVDTSEAASAVAEEMYGEQAQDVPEALFKADVRYIEADHERRNAQ